MGTIRPTHGRRLVRPDRLDSGATEAGPPARPHDHDRESSTAPVPNSRNFDGALAPGAGASWFDRTVRARTPPPLTCTNCGCHTSGPILRWGSRRREHVVCQVCCGDHFDFGGTCGWCGRAFHYSGQGRRLYCTESCRRSASASRAGRLGGPTEAHCAVCGSHFMGRRADAVYCSSSCRQLAYRRRHPAVPLGERSAASEAPRG
jgi:hypothetical protein